MTVAELKKLLNSHDYEDNTKIVILCGSKFVDFKQGASESLTEDLKNDYINGDCSIVLEPIIPKK